MIHSPKLSEKNFGIISDSLEGFEDNSWVNDACDSVYSRDLDIGIYFPTTENTNVDNVESFDTFSVILNQESLNQQRHYSFNTVEEVVEFIKSQKN